MAARRAPPPLRAFALGSLLLVFFVGRPWAQAPAPESAALERRTDPLEVRSLNSIFRQWRLTAPPSSWNLTGDPCTGTAVDSTDIKNPNVNPALKCDCDQTTCHITQLRVYALDVVGWIPDELSNLKHLIVLTLMLNYLTGPLPAFIGNLTSMQWLVVSGNALSGPIPKELGNLQKLVTLGVTGNNFSGTLPPELGNITSLEQWYMDSCGLSGEIPASLSKLKNLQKFWASDNHFTGKIPDFIGAWTNLTDLRLQGNSFKGPIPSALASLTKLSDLRIGEIENVSSSLDFVQNMTSLTTLILRNCKISGSIPFDFRHYSSLRLLDLSFNNITGQLPAFLFNLNPLSHLFLGNNSLIGSLPTQKSPSLLNIDLSYNELSGPFPSWVSDERLHLNLVFNNFVIGDSNSSVLPSGLNCLQRDIPCNRLSPIYSSFGIKCGGSRTMTASDGTVYEIDDKNLTTASYYVTETEKWAVSSIGQFIDASTPAYRWSILNQFTNTLDSELFQTARLSPSSLRYYGLGLQNGNYTVKLQFAETAFPDTPLSWRTTGNRIFDIYIQGRCKEKDFNIRKTAGGSYRAVVRDYIALVTDNFLEIHFFWAGKGTCCIPTQGYYGPAISAISIAPSDFTPTVSNQPRSTSSTKKNTRLILGIAAGVAAVCLFFISGIFWWKAGRKSLSSDDDEERLDLSLRANTFSYAELKAATEDFNPHNKLGQGGFGSVFKGTLSDGRAVAVKQLSVASRQGKRQFVTEIDTISAVQHRSLVKLYGCCVEGDKRLLVYEYLENKSLDQALFGEKKLQLDWSTRFEICLGTARGLAYLHEESRVRIVHRDVKASNILLDCDLNPKISDFGLAKLYDDKKTHISTCVAGTIGYLSPEYAMIGHLTEKADVFSFGIVALEVISGRPNLDASLPQEKIYLLEWAWHLRENKCELEMVDPAMTKYNKEEALRVIGVSLLCTQSSPVLRPAMSRVVAMLVGDMEVSDAASRPNYLMDWHFKDLSSTFTNTHNVMEASSLPVGASHVNMSSSNNGSTLGSWPSPMASQPMLQEVIREGW